MIPTLILSVVLSIFGGPTSFDTMAGSPTVTGPVPGLAGAPQSADTMAGSPTINGPH